MLDGIDGARTWCGWGVLAHNATKIAVLIDETRDEERTPLLRRRNAIDDHHRTTRASATATAHDVPA